MHTPTLASLALSIYPIPSPTPNPQVWSCIDLDLKPFDCSVQQNAFENPQDSNSNSNGTTPTDSATRRLQSTPPVINGASNSLCGRRVKIPPLRSRGGAVIEEEGGGMCGWCVAAVMGAVVVAASGRMVVRRRGVGRGELQQPLVA